MRSFKQRGDTLVEVLIAIAVLSMVIGAGYALATRSLNGVRVSQERSEATKIAESQMELLRSNVPASSIDGKCLKDDGTGEASGADCVRGLYTISIGDVTSVSGSQRTFTVNINWDRSGGGEEQTLRMVYRVNM